MHIVCLHYSLFIVGKNINKGVKNGTAHYGITLLLIPENRSSKLPKINEVAHGLFFILTLSSSMLPNKFLPFLCLYI